MTIWTALAMLGIGVLAIYLEFFVPAFGLIGIGGVAVIVTTVVLGFQNLPDQQALVVLLTAIFVTPAMIIVLLRRLPRSFIGKRLILNTQLGRPATGGSSPEKHQEGENSGITGMTGTAITPLHPSGVAEFENTRYSVVTNGEYLEAGTVVTVTGHFGSRIVVRGTKGDNNVI